MDVEHSLGDPDSYRGEPMVIDGSAQGLPFPHVIGEDGQHTVREHSGIEKSIHGVTCKSRALKCPW